MRTLIVALGLAAVAATPALAQTGVSRGSVSTTGAGTTGTASTTTTTQPSTTVGAEPVLSAPASSTSGTSTTAAGGATTAFGTNVTNNPNAATPGNSFGPGGSFSNDSGNSALGTSAGQTSSGTLAGNASSGIGADSTSLGTGNIGVVGTPTLVPDGTVSVIGGGSAGGQVVGVPATQSQQVTIAPATQTPLFNQVAREGRAKEAARRARGEEPRIYGIAPNTDRDLTHQMPDDRIIRY